MRFNEASAGPPVAIAFNKLDPHDRWAFATIEAQVMVRSLSRRNDDLDRFEV
jgi:hypothetical protein